MTGHADTIRRPEETLGGILAPWPGPNAAYLTQSQAKMGRQALLALLAERQQLHEYVAELTERKQELLAERQQAQEERDELRESLAAQTELLETEEDAHDETKKQRQQAIDALRLADKALQIVQTRRLRFSAEAAYRKLHGLPSDRSPEEVALDDAVAAYFDSAALLKFGEKP